MAKLFANRETLIRRRVLRRLIWVCTVCQLSFLWISRLQWVQGIKGKELKHLNNSHKYMFAHMRTTKYQISLAICTVWQYIWICAYRSERYFVTNDAILNQAKHRYQPRHSPFCFSMHYVKAFYVCSNESYGSDSTVYDLSPASNLCKSIAGRYRPVSYPDGPTTARYGFIKNAYWEDTWVSCQKTDIWTYAPSKDSDQPANWGSDQNIKMSTFWIGKDANWLYVNNKIYGQTERSRRLIWIFDREHMSEGTFSDVASHLDDKFPKQTGVIVTSRKHPYIILNPLNPTFMFTGVYNIFSYFAKNIDCGYSLEPPCRGSSSEYIQSMFWIGIWKISEFVFIWMSRFLVAKFSIYLIRRVFVMICG